MKTNVIFKNGLNLVCDDVDVYSSLTFLYIHNVSDSTRLELMNEALKKGWNCSFYDLTIHPKAIKLSVRNGEIKQFSAVMP